ncbi:hypothetical protein ACVI1L_006726 [Bradyrhizobium sp. USDA 4516]
MTAARFLRGSFENDDDEARPCRDGGWRRRKRRFRDVETGPRIDHSRRNVRILREQGAEAVHAVVRDEGELVSLIHAGVKTRQEQACRDVVQLEIGDRQQVVHDANHLCARAALDRNPGRSVDENDVVVARIDPRRRQPGQGRGVLIAVEAGLEQEIAEQFEMAQVGRNVFEALGPVLDQLNAGRQQINRAQEGDDEFERGRRVELVLEPVDGAAQAAAHDRRVHVCFIEVTIEREQVGFVEAARRSGRNARQAGIAARHHRRHELLKRNLGDPAGFRDRKVESGRRHGAVRGDGGGAGLRDTRWRAREPCPEMILFQVGKYHTSSEVGLCPTARTAKS